MAKYAPGLSRMNPGIQYMENVRNHYERHNGPRVKRATGTYCKFNVNISCIELVFSSARLTSVKFQQVRVCVRDSDP